MYVKQLSEDEKEKLQERRNKINDYQEKGICFSCLNFETGDIFPDDGLIIYEDEITSWNLYDINLCLRSKYANT